MLFGGNSCVTPSTSLDFRCRPYVDLPADTEMGLERLIRSDLDDLRDYAERAGLIRARIVDACRLIRSELQNNFSDLSLAEQYSIYDVWQDQLSSALGTMGEFGNGQKTFPEECNEMDGSIYQSCYPEDENDNSFVSMSCDYVEQAPDPAIHQCVFNVVAAESYKTHDGEIIIIKSSFELGTNYFPYVSYRLSR